jgi:hypothetical protein
VAHPGGSDVAPVLVECIAGLFESSRAVRYLSTYDVQ